MKLLKRLPRWLRFSGLAVFVTLCVGINAIAFTEIHRRSVAAIDYCPVGF